ncbi:MAG: hypothetical protein WKF70_08010 [Chitinophagaceae bacterium]
MLVAIVRIFLLGLLYVTGNGCSSTQQEASEPVKTAADFLIKGVSMVAPVNAIGDVNMKPITNLNANSISVMPYAFFSLDNFEIRYNQHGQHWGENIEGVAGCIQLAHENGLSVMLKPHLWIGRGMYTGAFTLSTEKEWQVWEESYSRYILHFARVADSMKTELFCIGTELGAAIKKRPQYWSSLIDSVKTVYHGKLTYAANWDDYKDVPFWEKLDYIGVDAYFPLIKDKTPSLTSLRKNWNGYSDELEEMSKRNNRPILFTEYGYRNVDRTAAEPWKENEGELNNEAQTNSYEALYQTFVGKGWFSGGYVWKWYVEEGRRRRPEIDYTPQNKPAQKIIQRWYGMADSTHLP